jgi:hypothetical protein
VTAIEANVGSAKDQLLEAKAHGELLSGQYDVALSASYSKAPDWLDHVIIREVGIGAAAKASAKGQIGKSGASLELEAKAGFGADLVHFYRYTPWDVLRL